MLHLRRIGTAQARYYLEGPEGRWAGRGCQDLGLNGAVEQRPLQDVLAGRRAAGRPLLQRVPSNRRAGFDLIFAAPKSVSLLAALAPAHASCRLVDGHERAVADALTYLERWATTTCRLTPAASGPRQPLGGHGLIAASFVHDRSWAGDPHLHTHLVVANLVRAEDGVWSCLDSRALYRHSRTAGRLYQCALRYHLSQLGFGLSWTLRSDGLGDVVGVPRAAIDACSIRRRHILNGAGPQSSPRLRVLVAGRTRVTIPVGPPDEWKVRAEAAGFDRNAADRLLVPNSGANFPKRPRSEEIERVLTRDQSTFERSDVVRALAITTLAGAPLSSIEQWAGDFLAGAVPVGPGRWTTSAERRLTDAIVRRATARPSGPNETTTEAPRTTPSSVDDAVSRLTEDRPGVAILHGSGLVAQAAVLDEARSVWASRSHRVAIVAASDRALGRWEALTGLEPPPAGPAKPTVTIVDGADRLNTQSLNEYLTDAAARGTKLVLIEGGTSGTPRREPASLAFAGLKGIVSPIDPGPSPVAAPTPPNLVRGGRDASVSVAAKGRDAIERMVADWHLARDGPVSPTMVALGPDEATHLNQLARARRHENGELLGPVLRAGRQPWQAGDEVRTLRRDPRLGPVPSGTVGTVQHVDIHRRELTIQWPTTTVTVPAAIFDGRPPLTHAYATTPAYTRRLTNTAILALGDIPGATDVYAIAPAPQLGRDHDRLDGHLERPPAVLLDDATRTLPDLHAERQELGDRLRTTAPADPGPALRRLEEQRAWLESRRPTSDRQSRLTDLDHQRTQLLSADRVRRSWIEQHRDQFARWADLGVTIAWRQAAIGKAAELRPTHAVEAALGPMPQTPRSRQRWQEAARMIESHRDRAQLPDQPLKLGHDPDDLRVRAACRAVERTRELDRVLAH